jgi:amidohydrolase
MPRKLALSLALCLLCSVLLPAVLTAQPTGLDPAVEALCRAVDPKVVAWRRDFHQHPELSNREFRTAAAVAAHLESLGLDVQQGVAHTGVVGVLKGGQPGPVVALRADMDGLPVTERVELPFASKARGEYNGEEVGVMHACGHDTHTAILMGAAEVLAGMRADLPGTVKFLFQPAEEGPPEGEAGGAELMVKEGVLEDPKVDAAFALHIFANIEVGTLAYRSGGMMASADDFRITVHGAQTHGASPWNGIDPIVTAAQIITGLQTIVSRQHPVTESAAVVTVGSIHGGVRSNIVPEEVVMVGTLRALDPQARLAIHDKVRRIATHVAESMGATAEVEIPVTTAYPVTYNDPELTARMVPVLRAVAGQDNVRQIPAITGAEDFSFIAEQVPGFYFVLGGRPKDIAEEDATEHHTPDFFVDEAALPLGVRAMVGLALGYLQGGV